MNVQQIMEDVQQMQSVQIPQEVLLVIVTLDIQEMVLHALVTINNFSSSLSLSFFFFFLKTLLN